MNQINISTIDFVNVCTFIMNMIYPVIPINSSSTVFKIHDNICRLKNIRATLIVYNLEM